MINTLNRKKATLSNDIPTKIIQQFSEIFKDFLYNNFNSCLESGMFPDELKLVEVVSVYKKNGEKYKRVCYQIENYVGRTFVNSKLCKKLVALLIASRT